VQSLEMEIPAARLAGGIMANPPAPLTRSRGAADLRFKLRDRTTVFDTLYQSGCLRVRMPASEPGLSPDAIVINTSGGLTGGDEISLDCHWQIGTSAALCSQAAEKIYRSTGPDVQISNRLHVHEGASAEWLPQETIIFDRARMNRKFEVDVACGARFLALESLVFGRTAMGEEVTSGFVRDSWRIRIGGALVYADAFQIAGAIARKLDRAAIGSFARAFGTILLIAQENLAALVDDLRAAFAAARGRAAASQWNGILAARFLAPDGEVLKHDIALALNVLRAGRPLPRAWRC
jgi:urease accessory protein